MLGYSENRILKVSDSDVIPPWGEVTIGEQVWADIDVGDLTAYSDELNAIKPNFFVYVKQNAWGNYLYDYFSALIIEAIFPGWRLPTPADFSELNTYLSGAGKLKEVGTTHWNSPNTGAEGLYGWDMVGNGWYGQGGFFFLKQYCFYWTSESGKDVYFPYNSSTYIFGSARNLYTCETLRFIKIT